MIEVDELIEMALKEDIGDGDITTSSVMKTSRGATAHLIAKEKFILAGIDIFHQVYKKLDQPHDEADAESHRDDYQNDYHTCLCPSGGGAVRDHAEIERINRQQGNDRRQSHCPHDNADRMPQDIVFHKYE